MSKLTYIFLFASLLSVCWGVQLPPQPIPPNGTDPVPTLSPVIPTDPPTPEPTTPSSTTVKPEPPTTPSTTTVKPEPPTTPSTTTAKPEPPTTPSTTTEKPEPPTTPSTTTTKPEPPTTAAPTPAPTPSSPSTGTWMINSTTNNVTETCVIVKMALQAKFTMSSGNSSKSMMVNLPVNTTATGDCGAKDQTMKITWGSDSLELKFAKNNNSEFMLSDIVLSALVDGSTIVASHEKSEFIVPLKMSYKCDREEVLKLNTTTNNTVAEITLSHVQIEAFRSGNTTVFSTAQDCWTPTADIVPIVVGCALAGLVVLVLVAYLVGRRRATARGYLSM